MGNDRILRITNVEETDSGLYRCVQGEVTITEVSLDVLVPPKIISHYPHHIRFTVKEGGNAKFSCSASGKPIPKIIWQVNGLLRSSNIIKNESSTFILHNVSRTDSGRVECIADNELSKVSRQFLLNVKYKPTVTVPSMLPLHFRLYDTATLVCIVCSNPLPLKINIYKQMGYFNFKEKFEIKLNDTCTQLTITISIKDPTLFGLYVCKSKNNLGSAQTELFVKAQDEDGLIF
ncbi:unnamed protein product, partial [Didymodactylos carnosus]